MNSDLPDCGEEKAAQAEAEPLAMANIVDVVVAMLQAAEHADSSMEARGTR